MKTMFTKIKHMIIIVRKNCLFQIHLYNKMCFMTIKMQFTQSLNSNKILYNDYTWES